MTCFRYGLPLHGGCAHKSPLSRNAGTAWKRPRRATSPAYATMQTSTVSGMSDKPARRWGGQSAPGFVHAMSQAQMHALGYFAHLFVIQTLQPTSGSHDESEEPKASMAWVHTAICALTTPSSACSCGGLAYFLGVNCRFLLWEHSWRRN